jgi:hypothetical protein
MISLLQHLFPVLFGFSLLMPLERPAGKKVLRVLVPVEAATCSCKATATPTPGSGVIESGGSQVAQLGWAQFEPKKGKCDTRQDPDSEQGPTCKTKEGSQCTLQSSISVLLLGSWAALPHVYIKVTKYNTNAQGDPQWAAFNNTSPTRIFNVDLKSACKTGAGSPDDVFLLSLSPTNSPQNPPSPHDFTVTLTCDSCAMD